MAALRVAYLTLALLALLPAAASADPAGAGEWRPGGDPSVVIFDLQLNSDGTVRFAAIDLPSPVAGVTADRAPAGTSCRRDAAEARRVRCGFGPDGWKRGQAVTLT